MAKVVAICTECNENIKLKNDKEVAYCSKCRAKVSVAECISLYSGSVAESVDVSNDAVAVVNTSRSSQEKVSYSSKQTSESSLSGLIFLGLLITAAYFKLYYTHDMASKEIVLFGQNLINQSYIIQESFGIKEGIVNALLVLGKSINGIFIDGGLEYIHGFKGSILFKAFWLVVGFMWSFMKSFLFFFPKYLVMVYQTLIQGSGVAYYLSYIVTTVISLKALSLFDDGN